MSDNGADTTNVSHIPVRFRIIAYTLAAIIGIVALPYLLAKTFVQEWRREFAKEWRRRHVKASPDEIHEVRLRHRPDR